MINSKTQKTVKKEKSFKSFNEFQLPAIQEKLSSCRLGPGSYNISYSTLNGPSHQFSQAIRFEFSDPYQKYFKSHKKHSSFGNSSEVNLETFHRDYKISIIKQNALTLNKKLSETKIKKQKILQGKKQKLLNSLKEKSLKFEFRQRMKESKSASEIFKMFLVMISVSARLHKKMSELVSVRKRSGRYGRIFARICLVLGKFKMISKRMEVFRSYKVIKRAAKLIKNWLEKRKEAYREIISRICFRYLKRPGLVIAISKFIEIVKGTQRAWRRCLSGKKAALKARVFIYREIEKIVLGKNKDKAIGPAQKRMVQREIKTIRLKRLKKYLSDLGIHKKRCEEIDNENKKRRKNKKFYLQAELRHVEYPERPVPYYFIDKNRYIQMVAYLTAKRSQTDIKLEKRNKL